MERHSKSILQILGKHLENIGKTTGKQKSVPSPEKNSYPVVLISETPAGRQVFREISGHGARDYPPLVPSFVSYRFTLHSYL